MSHSIKVKVMRSHEYSLIKKAVSNYLGTQSTFNPLAVECLAYEQTLVLLKLKKSIDAEGGRTLAVMIEGG